MFDSPDLERPTEDTLGSTKTTGIVSSVIDQLQPVLSEAAQTVTGRLPAERKLAQQLAVSRGTIRHALLALATTGQVAATPNSGWYVRDAPLIPPVRKLVSFTEMARRRGQSVSAIIMHQLVRLATYEEREVLKPKEAATVLDLLRLRLVDGRPVCVDRVTAALWRLPNLDSYEFTDRSLYEVISICGETPMRSDVTLEALSAGIWAESLQVLPSDPVIAVDEVTYGRFGAPILIGRAIYRADSYRFQATLTARAALIS